MNNKLTTDQQLGALQNAANLINCTVHKRIIRKGLIKFFIVSENHLIQSPVLNFNDLNHYILGAIQFQNN